MDEADQHLEPTAAAVATTGPQRGAKRRQTASRKLNRTNPVSVRMVPADLNRVREAAERDGLGQSDWLSTAVEAVLIRGISPITYSQQPDIKDVRASLVNLANARVVLLFALGMLDRPRATQRRKAIARDALAQCDSILRSTNRRLG